MMAQQENGKKKHKRKMTEKQLANLRPATKETAAVRGRAGAIKANEKIARKRTMREILDVLLSMPSSKRVGMSQAESICVELAERAEDGNLRAIELLRDTIGQRPTERDNNTITGNVIVQWQQNNEGVSPAGVVVDNGKQQVSLDSTGACLPASVVDSNNVV